MYTDIMLYVCIENISLHQKDKILT